jgi:hypothetical protein
MVGAVKRAMEEIESLEFELGRVMEALEGIARQNARFSAAIATAAEGRSEDVDPSDPLEADMAAALDVGLAEEAHLESRRSEIEDRLHHLGSLRQDPEDEPDLLGEEPPVLRLDVGVHLLQPVTVLELRGVEAALTIIERAIDQVALTTSQEHRVRALLSALEAQRREASPGKTPRWKILGAAGTVLMAVAVELPQGIAAWPEAARILRDIGWPSIAELFSRSGP